MTSLENTSENPWFKPLNHASWWTFGLAVLLLIPGWIFRDAMPQQLIYNFREGIIVNFPLATAIGIALVSILVSIIAMLLKKIPTTVTDTFWLKRAFFDSMLTFVMLPTVFLAILKPFLSFLSAPQDYSAPVREVSHFTSYSLSLTNLSPLFFFVIVGITQLSLAGVLLLRSYFKTLPPHIFKFSFKNLKNDFVTIILGLVFSFCASVLYSLIIHYLKITIPPQYSFTPEIKTQFWLVLLSGVILAPLCEELFFRGYLFSILSRKHVWRGIILSSLIFAAVHLHLLYFVPLFIVGITLSYAYVHTKNLLVPITIHAIHNLFAFLVLIFLTS